MQSLRMLELSCGVSSGLGQNLAAMHAWLGGELAQKIVLAVLGRFTSAVGATAANVGILFQACLSKRCVVHMHDALSSQMKSQWHDIPVDKRPARHNFGVSWQGVRCQGRRVRCGGLVYYDMSVCHGECWCVEACSTRGLDAGGRCTYVWEPA
ncbi:hypothetical protein COO60DRAFT_1553709 [Scenedesmus sp. NREL 46B-D3]|nr:hypothetical protein COO60DRAFT_1553709 [Scenedesmus sp. NREL 46B-D3]